MSYSANSRPDPIDAARALVDERFPECTAAIVGGSIIRGDGNATSDLDIVIFTNREEAPYRESLIACGWPVELFVHTTESYQRYVKSDVERLRPSLLMMTFEGVILRDQGGLAKRVREEAGNILERGPEPLTPEEMANRRYALTDLLDDFLGSERFDEGMFIAGDLAVEAANLVLAHHRHWLGSGKWVSRALARHNPDLARALTQALETYYRIEDKSLLVNFAEGALSLVGGRLFEGYYSRGS